MNTLIEHVRALNMRERQLHEQRREAAIAAIKARRSQQRSQQETSACADASGPVQQRISSGTSS